MFDISVTQGNQNNEKIVLLNMRKSNDTQNNNKLPYRLKSLRGGNKPFANNDLNVISAELNFNHNCWWVYVGSLSINILCKINSELLID